MFDRRLIEAEILKLRRRRGLIRLSIGILALLVASFTVANIVDPPTGGLVRYHAIVDLLGTFAAIIGVMIGATAGAGDLEAGVFRDLAATGRSRSALFAARIPGALAVVIPIALSAITFEAVWCTVFAGAEPGPSLSQFLDGIGVVTLAGAIGCVISVGLASAIGSRGTVIGVALAGQLAVSPVVAQIKALGDIRVVIPRVAIDRLSGLASAHSYSTLAAVATLACWAALAVVAGLRRSLTQEL